MLSDGGGIISESGGDYFSELGGEIISESGGGLPRNLQADSMHSRTDVGLLAGPGIAIHLLGTPDSLAGA